MEYFKNDRFVTPGILNNVPSHLVLTLWCLIDNIPDNVPKDYYQFFSLKTIGKEDTQVQVIEHWQERPDYHSPIIYIPYGPFYTGKIYCIDDTLHSVMCTPEER